MPYYSVNVWLISIVRLLYLFVAAMSGAGNLPCSHVIHVHSPNWSTDKGVDELKKSVENALQLAEDKELESLAFPSIASGS